MGIWILTQTRNQLVLCSNVLIGGNKTEILDWKGIYGGSENYETLGTYLNEEECKKVLLQIIKFLRNRSRDDEIFEMPLDATIHKYRED